jgi:N-acetylmuramic acid 6-phosphate etherase
MGERTVPTDSLEGLLTEAGGRVTDHDLLGTRELVLQMNAEDASVPAAVAATADAIAAAIDDIVARLAEGGRLIYAGAGSSGLIAALDAAECGSTFSTEPGQVVAVVAGAEADTAAAREAAEDDADAGTAALTALAVSGRDAVVVVSASGRTPFALGAARAAADAGALTACVVSVPGSELAALVDHELQVLTGPEFIAGSTRLKAGTAQKLVLNTISTVSMIRLGKTFGNLMVDVAPTNEKLRARVHRIVETATGATRDEVDGALEAAAGDAKVAIVSLLAGVDAATARARLDAVNQNVRLALRP